MTRTSAREFAVRLVYELSFSERKADELLYESLQKEYFDALQGEDELYEEFSGEDEQQFSYIRTVVTGVDKHGPELDDYISRYAIGWNFARISRIDTAIMRVAMYEILYMPDIPDSAAVNEALEIAKKYESEEAIAFINGILGSFIRRERDGLSEKPGESET
jgi:N utilization substance protein B